MDGTSYAIGAILLLLVIHLVWTTLLVRSVMQRTELLVSELDHNLAAALASTVETLPASLEAVNPLQAIIAQWIGAQIEAKGKTIDATITPVKGEGGQFVKKILEGTK